MKTKIKKQNLGVLLLLIVCLYITLLKKQKKKINTIHGHANNNSFVKKVKKKLRFISLSLFYYWISCVSFKRNEQKLYF